MGSCSCVLDEEKLAVLPLCVYNTWFGFLGFFSE